jgi:hypothetical protein
MLGLTGRCLESEYRLANIRILFLLTLQSAGEESDSADEITIQDSASGTETEDPDATSPFNHSAADLSPSSSVDERGENDNTITLPFDSKARQPKAATVAATRGLNVMVDRRRSGAPGLYIVLHK